jgi:hypothetical protein
MNRRTAATTALAFALSPVAAWAGEGADKKKEEIPHSVDLSPVGVPIVWQGKIVNYIFITVKLPVAPRVDATKLREREPFFRDALVRAAHRTPFVKPWDFTHVDRAALTAAMMRESARIAGPGVIVGVEIVDEQPQRRVGLPKPPAPAAPNP